MTQALYAHMNNKNTKQTKKTPKKNSYNGGLRCGSGAEQFLAFKGLWVQSQPERKLLWLFYW
jgi:hypothetical protein